MTKKQLAKRVLVALGVIDRLQSPTSDDEKTVLDIYLEHHSSWLDRNLIRWDSDDIPLEISGYVVKFIALECANEFSVSDSRFQRLQMQAVNSQQFIIAHDAPPYTEEISKYY